MPGDHPDNVPQASTDIRHYKQKQGFYALHYNQAATACIYKKGVRLRQPDADVTQQRNNCIHVTTCHVTCVSHDCRVTTPAFWTNTSQITFNFTGFQAADPQHTLQYQWGLGTTPDSTNTIPLTAFTGIEMANTIFMTNGRLLRNVTVFQQSYSLTNATALVEGQEYHVTVQASSSGPAAAVAASQSTTVKVSLEVCSIVLFVMCQCKLAIMQCAACLPCLQCWQTVQDESNIDSLC